MFFPVEDWFIAFVLTLVVETPVVIVLLRRAEPDLVRVALLVIFANLATHPVVWFVITQLFLVGTGAYLVVAESWAIGMEALLYAIAIRGVGARLAVATSLVANVSSILAGLLVGGLRLELVP